MTLASPSPRPTRLARSPAAGGKASAEAHEEGKRVNDLQLATFNILQDYEAEKAYAQDVQRATLNILRDYEADKSQAQNMQRATFNILADLEIERYKLEQADRELAKRAADLSRSNADLERFAHVASHDLQEPLRVMASYVALIEQNYKGLLDETGARWIHYVTDASQRMIALIKDLLEFARVGSQGRPFQQVDTRMAFGDAMGRLAVSVKEAKAHVTCGPLPVVLADRTQFAQLFQNLIGNAIKFTKKGEAPQIRVGAVERGARWEFQVADEGIGFDAQYGSRIFEMFQRLHNRDEYAGTGIGLSICQRIVQRHGGEIWAASELGRGSTFFFTIPKEQNPSV